MPIAVVGLILLSVTLSAIAQISLKIGMSSPAVSRVSISVLSIILS